MVGRTLGGYRLEEQIGEGAFGKVYRALHVDMGWTGAVKVAREARFGTLLREEGKLLARLKHPNIVSILHMETGGETPFVVMEYVDGESLASRLKRGPLTAEQTIELATRLLDGLAAAHELDILHRDIKPSNILIAADGTPKLADFGLGRVVAEESLRQSMGSLAAGASMMRSQLSQDASDSGELVGTIAYMAPEQMQGGQIDCRADLYSLGIVLYEAVTERLPAGRFKLPGEFLPAIPETLDAALDALLAGERDDRPGSATAAEGLFHASDGVLAANPATSAQKAKEPARTATPAKSTDARWAEAEAYCARRRSSGSSDAEIGEALRGAGWQSEQIEKLLGGGLRPPGASAVAAGSRTGEETVGPHGGVLVWVPGGSFTMGSDDGEADESPVHRVELDGFWTGKTEVTVGEWRSVMGSVPGESNDRGDDHPVVNVSWHDCQEFCGRTGLALPTEAQWEYAARGPESRVYPWGNAWDAERCCNNKNRGGLSRPTFPVGSFPAGASWCGALDMAGNVREWCLDWHDGNYYQNSPTRNPGGPSSGEYRVVRGGSWIKDAVRCRSAYRDNSTPDVTLGLGGAETGFRVSRSGR